MPSVIISVWTPRSRTPLSSSATQTAFGMPPMPICRQAPSSISAAMWRGDRAVDVARRRVAELRDRLAVALDDVVDLADVHAVLRPVDVGHGRRSSRRSTGRARSTMARW